MPIIVDPDSLNDGVTDNGSTEVFIDTVALTIKLNVTGNLTSDGVTEKVIYSFLKEEWTNDPNAKTLAAFPFPMVPITDESFEFVDGWNYADDTTRYLVRTGGWTVKNTSGDVTEIWAGIMGLGDVDADDQVYFDNSGTAVDFELTGQVNQAVQVLSDPNGDNNFADGFDRRASFSLFVREQGQVFDQANLPDIGVTSMSNIAYRFPLGTAVDLKVTTADTGIDANSDDVADVAPYSGMSITYHATPQSKAVGGSNYDFGVIIEGNGGTAEEIYEFVQWQLRLDTDIDAGAGTVTGKTADELLEFVGDTLKTKNATNPAGGGTGVYIDNFAVADTNRITLRDNTEAERSFPFVATITIQFGDNLVSDTAAYYWLYFDAGDAATPGWGSANAVVVQDNDAVDIKGLVSAQASVTHTFDYSGNTQGGRTGEVDAQVMAVAIGADGAQYVRAAATIARSTSNSVALVSPLERNYENAI